MRAQRLVLVRGMRDTRATLAAWNLRPWQTLREWVLTSAAVSIALLAAVWLVARLSTPDPTPLAVPGVNAATSAADVLSILGRNCLVLALHGFACLAGFMAGSSLPQLASTRTGLSRLVHERAGPLAIAFVVGATAFSLATQAYVLGSSAATIAAQLHVGDGTLIVALVPHALPELTALFLPLAAWVIASRRGEWSQLLAATFVTVAIALPVLAISALVEVYVSPHLLRALSAS